jgi:hypothetical protein
MGRGGDIFASRAASMTSEIDKKERRRGPSIKDGAVLDTGFLLDIVETGMWMWITRTLMTVKLTVSVYPAPAEISTAILCPVQTRTNGTYYKET